MSADPLAVHAPGAADLNVYAYVSGAVLKNIDPLGLDDESGGGGAPAYDPVADEAVDVVGTDTPGNTPDGSGFEPGGGSCGGAGASGSWEAPKAQTDATPASKVQEATQSKTPQTAPAAPKAKTPAQQLEELEKIRVDVLGGLGVDAGSSTEVKESSVRTVDVNDIRYSQRTAGGGGRAADLRQKMASGWDPKEGPLDVVETEKGLVTLDNTRPAVARELGIPKVTARVHDPSEPLPDGFAAQRGLVEKAEKLKLPAPKTWGDFLRIRTTDNRLPVTGTAEPPKLPK